MKNDFQSLVDTRLSGLTWSDVHTKRVLRERSARQGRQQASFSVRHLRPIVVLCAMFVLLSATALAMGLRATQRYTITQQAQVALSEAYGLTNEMLDLFSASLAQEENARTVTFTPLAAQAKAIGVYTVCIHADGTQTVQWSHDGEELQDTGDLSSPIWSAKQLEMMIGLRRNHAEQIGQMHFDGSNPMTLEERAQIDAWLLEDGNAVVEAVLHIAPTAQDVQATDAIAIAKQAVSKKYGARIETLACAPADLTFLLYTENEQREYQIVLRAITGENVGREAYNVRILSPSGEIMSCRWWSDDPCLPAGDLRNYADAVREYMDVGAFGLLPPAEKAVLAVRITQAGLGDLLPDTGYITPNAQDLRETAAVSRATDEMIQRYGLTEDTLTLFDRQTALIAKDGKRVWKIHYRPLAPQNAYWYDMEKTGAYTLLLDASDGAVLEHAWSLAGTDNGVYTARTWGAAKAYSATLLPWLQTLLDAQQTLLAKYPPYTNPGDMSVADDAAYSQLMLDAGFDLGNNYCTLPDATDLQEPQAIQLALQILVDERGLERAQLLQCEMSVHCRAITEEENVPKKVWSISFFGYGNGGLDGYTVVLNARDGTLDTIFHDSPSVGNG